MNKFTTACMSTLLMSSITLASTPASIYRTYLGYGFSSSNNQSLLIGMHNHNFDFGLSASYNKTSYKKNTGWSGERDQSDSISGYAGKSWDMTKKTQFETGLWVSHGFNINSLHNADGSYAGNDKLKTQCIGSYLSSNYTVTDSVTFSGEVNAISYCRLDNFGLRSTETKILTSASVAMKVDI